MKKISYWAKNHKWGARILMVFSFVILDILAIIIGYLFSQVGILFSPIFLFCFFTVLLLAIIVYPSKVNKRMNLSSSAFYNLQKTCDFIIVACTFCMIVYLSNKPEELFHYYPQVNASLITHTPKDNLRKNYKSISDFYSSLKERNGTSLKWKERKKLLRKQVRSIKKDNNLSTGAKVVLIFLSVLAALGLLFLVAGLACGLSCGGSDALAVIVLLGGTALVIFLLVITIRAIIGKKRKRASNISPPNQG